MVKYIVDEETLDCVYPPEADYIKSKSVIYAEPAIPEKDNNVQIPVEPPMPSKLEGFGFHMGDAFHHINAIRDRLTWYERQTRRLMSSLRRLTS